MPARSSGGRQLLPLGTVSLEQHWFGEGLESAGAVTSDFSTFYFFFLVFFFLLFFSLRVIIFVRLCFGCRAPPREWSAAWVLPAAGAPRLREATPITNFMEISPSEGGGGKEFSQL